jgi:hypothetical protein
LRTAERADERVGVVKLKTKEGLAEGGSEGKEERGTERQMEERR